MDQQLRRLQDAVVRWDVTNWWRAIEFWERNLPENLSGTESLEIGCGCGGVSLWLARKGSHVVCTDCTDPQPVAESLHHEWRVSDHIQYQTVDATHLPYENLFDIAVFKSVLGAIGRYGDTGKIRAAVQELYRALKPGGKLLFAENLDTAFHRVFRRHFVVWGKSWNYITRSQLLSMLSSFSEVKYGTCGFAGAFGRTAEQRRILGEIDKHFLDRIVGEPNHYILFGIARK